MPSKNYRHNNVVGSPKDLRLNLHCTARIAYPAVVSGIVHQLVFELLYLFSFKTAHIAALQVKTQDLVR